MMAGSYLTAATTASTILFSSLSAEPLSRIHTVRLPHSTHQPIPADGCSSCLWQLFLTLLLPRHHDAYLNRSASLARPSQRSLSSRHPLLLGAGADAMKAITAPFCTYSGRALFDPRPEAVVKGCCFVVSFRRPSLCAPAKPSNPQKESPRHSISGYQHLPEKSS